MCSNKQCIIASDLFKTKQEAIDSWNTRPETGLEKFIKEYGGYFGVAMRKTADELLKEED